MLGVPLMTSRKKSFNPFYVVLLVSGTLFAITACAYAVMMVKGIEPLAVREPGDDPFMTFMDRNGLTAMLIELAVIAAATFGAIGTDEFWQRRGSRVRQVDTPGLPGVPPYDG